MPTTATTTATSKAYQSSRRAAPDVLAHVEALLAEFDQTRVVLVETHRTIPELLRERRELTAALGQAENTGSPEVSKLRDRLSSADLRYEGAGRRRRSAIQALAIEESELAAARAATADALARHAVEAIGEFQARYVAAVRTLQGLWAEGDALALALRTKVEMPMPCELVASRVSPPALARVMPSPPPAPPPLSAASARLGSLLDRLDAALQCCGAIRNAETRGRTLGTLDTRRGWDPAGTYRVVRAFNSLIDGQVFEVGALVDSSVVDLVSLYRCLSVKNVILASA